MQKAFSIGEALRFGWEKTKAHSGVLFQAMFVLFGVEIVGSIIDRVLGQSVEAFAAHMLLTVLSVIFTAGFIVITLKLARGHKAHWRDLIPESALVWRYILASLLSTVLIILGLILLIIPGLYLMLRFAFASFVAIDGAGARESLRRSSKMTHGVKRHLLLFFGAAILLNIAGALLFLVGLLVTVPVTAIAYAHVYEKLKHHS